MKKCFKKAVSSILAAAMLVSSLTVSNVFAAPTFSKVGGWYETIYAEISGVTDSAVTGVSYSGTASGSLTGEDLTYLVRDCSGGVRIDIPGLKAGTYTLTVTTTSGTVTQSNIVVDAYDRSGYAHYNYTEGVGAYNDDGTVKDNAIILYVTEDNKNTVTLTYGGKTVSGIGNILNSRGASGTSEGLANTNQDILKDLGNNNIPLVVRIIGTVRAGDTNTSDNPPSVNIEGLTAYDSTDYGGSENDDGMMARIQNAKNITIEGIGDDASIDGWGIHFVCGTAAYAAGLGKSCEVRNIYFQNYPEDAFGAEGTQSGSTLTAPVERIWVHNNNFGPGYCKVPAESDKAEGDGSCDFKRGQYYTMAYNKYWDCHKTNLIGSSDPTLQYFITMHHNYYNNCMARGPLARQGNIHMYNNVYIGQTDYAMNPRANAYIFAEYNIFERCKNPVTLASGGVLGSLNNIYYSCSGDMAGVEMTSKTDTVTNANKYGDFVTNSSYSYIPSDNYLLQTEAADIKAYTLANAGVMNYTDEEDVNTSVISSVPTASVQLPYDKDLNKTYISSTGTKTIDNIIFSPTKVAADSLTLRAEGIVFNVAQEVDITITEVSGTYSPQLCSDSGVVYLTGSGTVTVPAGTYVIQSNVYDPGTAAYKECKISHLTILPHDPNNIIEGTTITTETPVETTTSSSQQTTTAQGGDDDTEETTSAPYQGEGLVWDYTNGTNTLNAVINANDWTSATPVTYNGSTFNEAIKFESSSSVTFTAPGSGTLTLVTYSSNASPYVYVNDEKVNVSTNGAVTVPITSSGTVTITKGTSSTYLYLMEFVGESTTETTTESTTETTTETTTQAPVQGVKVSVGAATATVGDTITVPVNVTGLSSLGAYTLTVTYDSTLLTPTDVVSGIAASNFEYNIADGTIRITYVNDNAGLDESFSGDTLANITFTANNSGIANIGLTVDEIYAADLTAVEFTETSGSVTIDEISSDSTRGDVNKDGLVNAVDAAIVLRIAAGLITDTTSYDMVAADCNVEGGDGSIDVLDAIWILNHKTTDTPAITGLAAGTYALNNSATIPEGIDISHIYGSDSTSIKVRDTTYIEIVPAVSGKISITWSSNAPKAVLVNSDGTETDLATATASPFEFNVTAGQTYRVYCVKASNATLSQLVLTAE